MRSLYLALVLAACAGDSRDDALAAVLAADDQGTAAAADYINGLPDPEQRQAALVVLLQERPKRTLALCQFLEGDDLVSTCRRRAGRAHLWSEPVGLPAADGGVVDGPATYHLDVDGGAASRFADVRARPGSCEDASSVSACASAAAVDRASKGDAVGAAELCAAVEGDPLRAECIFLSAEALVLAGGATVVEDASELCLEAGDFRTRCFAHLVLKPTVTVSASDALGADWSDEIAYAAAVEAWWARRDPAMAVVAVQRYWANATWRSVARARAVTGDLLDLVPTEHHPQVRAAVMRRLVTERPLGERDLAGWVGRAQEVLQLRASALPEEAFEGHSIRAREAAGTRDLWPSTVGGPAGMTAVIYMGTSRRVVADEPAVDLAICLLEDAARIGGAASQAILHEGRASDDPRVRWTVERLEVAPSQAPAAGPPGRQRR